MSSKEVGAETTESSDEELILRLSSGDTAALGDLYLRYGTQIQLYLVRLIGDRVAAEDLCQEVFLVLPDAAARYRETGAFRGWLFGIASLKAKAWRRRRWVRDGLLRSFGWLTTPQPPPGPADPGLRPAIQQAFESLPTELREVLLLQVGENMNGAEIAQALGISTGAVRVRLHRARQKIRERLVELEAIERGGP